MTDGLFPHHLYQKKDEERALDEDCHDRALTTLQEAKNRLKLGDDTTF